METRWSYTKTANLFMTFFINMDHTMFDLYITNPIVWNSRRNFCCQILHNMLHDDYHFQRSVLNTNFLSILQKRSTDSGKIRMIAKSYDGLYQKLNHLHISLNKLTMNQNVFYRACKISFEISPISKLAAGTNSWTAWVDF